MYQQHFHNHIYKCNFLDKKTFTNSFNTYLLTNYPGKTPNQFKAARCSPNQQSLLCFSSLYKKNLTHRIRRQNIRKNKWSIRSSLSQTIYAFACQLLVLELWLPFLLLLIISNDHILVSSPLCPLSLLKFLFLINESLSLRLI